MNKSYHTKSSLQATVASGIEVQLASQLHGSFLFQPHPLEHGRLGLGVVACAQQ